MTENELRRLPMTQHHVMLVLSGAKTTTLRTQPMRGVCGLYILGRLQARVDIEPLREIVLPVDLQQRDELVASEGYAGDEARWRAALCQILNVRGHTTGTDFLKGARKLWLHKLTVLGRFGVAKR